MGQVARSSLAASYGSQRPYEAYLCVKSRGTRCLTCPGWVVHDFAARLSECSERRLWQMKLVGSFHCEHSVGYHLTQEHPPRAPKACDRDAWSCRRNRRTGDNRRMVDSCTLLAAISVSSHQGVNSAQPCDDRCIPRCNYLCEQKSLT